MSPIECEGAVLDIEIKCEHIHGYLSLFFGLVTSARRRWALIRLRFSGGKEIAGMMPSQAAVRTAVFVEIDAAGRAVEDVEKWRSV